MGCISTKESSHHCSEHDHEVKAASPPANEYKRVKSKFRAISDKYESLEQVQNALRSGGLEGSNLIVAVDFTKSNEWQGELTFNGRNLHQIGPEPNHYEIAISTIGRTLAKFDDDNMIPVYGFGDARTTDKQIFDFFDNGRPARGFDEVLFRYRELAPHVQLSGPTSFAPAIRKAMADVSASGGAFHILLILADGQVSEGLAERETIRAISEATQYPLSIICIGVGDGPWDAMEMFDDKLEKDRAYDNFQFVELSKILAVHNGQLGPRFEASFALKALMELPACYKIIKKLGLLNSVPDRKAPPAMPPPIPESAGAGFAPPAPAPMYQGGAPPPFVPPPPGVVYPPGTPPPGVSYPHVVGKY